MRLKAYPLIRDCAGAGVGVTYGALHGFALKGLLSLSIQILDFN